MRRIASLPIAATAALIAGLLASTLAATASPAPEVAPRPAPAAYTISGTLAGSLTKEDGSACSSMRSATATSTAECDLRVVAILADGRGFASRPGDSGTKTFVITVAATAAARKDLTLHLVRANGAYVGPIVLKTDSFTVKSGARNVKKYEGAMSLGAVGASVTATRLGDVTVRKVDDKSAYADVSVDKLTTGSVTAYMCEQGVPYGAGKAGYVKVPASCKRPAGKSGRVGMPRANDVPAECSGFFNSQGTSAMTQQCWDKLAAAMGTKFTDPCPKASTVGKKLSQMGDNCKKLFSDNGNNNNNGGGDQGDPCAKQSSGGDQDGDGIPSAIDVDDNGNGIVDAADKATDGSCTIEPYKGLRARIGDGPPVNYGAVGGVLADRAAFVTALSNLLSNSFSIAYYVFDQKFFPGASTVGGIIPGIWITCTGVVWCDPSTSKATNGTNVEQRNAADKFSAQNGNRFEYSLNVPWVGTSSNEWCIPASEWGGGAPCWSSITKPMRFGSATDTNCQSVNYAPTYDPAGIPASARNFLWQQVCKEGNGVRVVQGAGIDPRIGSLAGSPGPSALSALDLLTLNYLTPGGGVAGVTTTLGTYPITTPMVKAFNGVAVDYSARVIKGSYANPVTLSAASPAAGMLTVEFYRPQREQFPGEEGTTGYHDMYNLSYGLEFEVEGTISKAQFGCGDGLNGTKGELPPASATNAYTQPVADQWTVNRSADDYAGFLAPMRDAVADSPKAEPASQTLTFAVNVVDCIQKRAAWLKTKYGIDVTALNSTGGDQPTTPRVDVNLTARGEAKTGGTDTARQGFLITFAAGTFTAPPQQP